MSMSKLQIYNMALRLCKERKLAALTDNREGRKLLDDAWGDGSTTGSVRRCLEAGQWSFAKRTVRIDYSPSITPPFGFRYAFDQPTDLVRVTGLFQDEDCQVPLTQYTDERRYWYSHLQTIYVQYVSNDAAYGADLSLWPQMFADTVAADLAHEIVGNLTQGSDVKSDVVKEWQYRMKQARGIDAQTRPTQMLPQGSWNMARGGRNNGSRWSGEFR